MKPSTVSLIALAVEAGVEFPTDHLPDADCANCEFTRLPHGDGHCYMFERSPGKKCGQFEPTKR